MGTVNLEEAKVSYEGQNLPAIHLIGKLQTQLEEAARRMAAIASTLGDIQSALLNSNMIEAKLTLSRADYDRFKSLGGTNDSERILKAVMSLIHPDVEVFQQNPAEAMPSDPFRGSEPVAPPAVPPTWPMQAAEAAPPPDPEPPGEGTFPGQAAGAEPPAEGPSTTQCPRCQSLIVLPETSGDQWSLEVKCENCGVKYLVKSRPDDHA